MEHDFILILDFGGSQAQSMARKLRGQNYYCEVHPGSLDPETIRKKAPRGLLLAGGPGNCELNGEILRMGLPVLAMGFCARSMATSFGAACEGALLTGKASQITFLPCPLFEGLGESDRFFERIDALKLPENFEPIATTVENLTPAFADLENKLYGLQFYAESNDPDGALILGNFADAICGCTAYWSPEFYIDREIEYLRERIGHGRAIMAISGGVDSTVCAELTYRAIGEQLTCVYVDTGLLRKDETETISRAFRDHLNLDLIVVDAKERVLNALKGIVDPQEKRRIVHQELSRALCEEAATGAEYLVEGTIYSDLLDGHPARPSGEIAGLKRIEPIRMLFKDEVRFVGETLGVPRNLLQRQPFPEPGLAVRCIGEVTAEKLSLLREADAIFRAEIQEAGLDRKLTQYFAILTNIQTLGLREGQTTTEYACALRAINAQDSANISVAKLPYDLIERVVRRITTQVPGINHVLYDVTGKPMAMAEWE